KEGSAYDLTIAMGVLAASQQIKSERISDYLIMGELALDGMLRPIKGVLPIAVQARDEGFKGFILPKQNAKEAAVVNGLEVIGVENILEVIQFFDEDKFIEPTTIDIHKEFYEQLNSFPFDFAD